MNIRSDEQGGARPGNTDLARTEALLARAAGATTAPAGLAQRIYAATVDLLPAGTAPLAKFGEGRSAARIELPNRRPAARARTIRLATWSRLALAAAVALAFIIPARVLWTGAAQPLSGNALLVLSRIGPEGERFVPNSAGSALGDRDAYETFGILGIGVDDLLGEIPVGDDALGG